MRLNWSEPLPNGGIKVKIHLHISPKFARTTALILGLIALGLTFLSVVSHLLSSFSSFGPISALNQLGNEHGEIWWYFDLNMEQNIPTWYSSSMLLLCSLLLAAIAVSAKRSGYGLYWKGLFFVLLFMSIDEATAIHEKVAFALRELLNTNSFLYYAWVLPYGTLVLLFGILYLTFLRDLPGQTRRLFIAASILFVGGALGGDVVEGYYDTLLGPSNLATVIAVHIEETLEMLGEVVFFYALLLHISLHVRTLHTSSVGSVD